MSLQILLDGCWNCHEGGKRFIKVKKIPSDLPVIRPIKTIIPVLGCGVVGFMNVHAPRDEGDYFASSVGEKGTALMEDTPAFLLRT